MMKIENIDRNFKLATVADKEVIYYDFRQKVFALEGFPWFGEHHQFYRIPAAITASMVNDGVLELSWHTAGGAIRFCTDSGRIALRAVLHHNVDMNHMPRTGSAGFDLYRGEGGQRIHVGTAQPSWNQSEIEVMLFDQKSAGMQEWLLNFPLYGGVKSLEIGVVPDARILPPPPHAVSKPILFYGSSITQGGCASRPGNAYTSMLCRTLDAEQINLGFSGSGRGEVAMAQAISALDLAALVMDYDHNAPDAEYLQRTHEPFFQIIRAAHPALPVIFVSKCDIWPHRNYATDQARRQIIRQTYENALAAGDNHVYFIDGETLFGSAPEYRSWCTVDGCHPNDLGFFMIYQRVLPVLQQALREA